MTLSEKTLIRKGNLKGPEKLCAAFPEVGKWRKFFIAE